uniref:tumor necrosis factor receptor superfamily member 14 isoform X2 n=1 Tax=Maylandia zebra TaxID=106582 RepID=UPI000D324B26|nr:tumor necrosis factor receptor superfamily member 14 isoform X2 [Maylandia zebra]
MSSRRKPVNATAFLIIVMTVFSGLSLTCHPAEYQIGNECCPKCPPGSRVKTHCKEYSSTSCAPCMGGTYTDQQNGLERCLSCTNCDSGTASTDTECSDCSSGTFSNGTFHSCQPHTQCHSLNLQLITEGTLAADNQCGEKSNHVTPTITVIVLIIVGLVLVLLVLLVLLCLKKKGIVFKSRNRKNSTLSSPKGEQAELHMQSQRGKPSEDKEKENGLLPPE